jgi:hypothetical protein
MFKHYHIYIETYIEHIPKVQLLEKTKGERKEENHDRELIIMKYSTSMQKQETH